jgi:hypothetical protein
MLPIHSRSALRLAEQSAPTATRLASRNGPDADTEITLHNLRELVLIRRGIRRERVGLVADLAFETTR